MNEEEFFNKYVMGNPFNLKKSIITHCRTLDKYDVYQWVADDEVKIKNLLEENQQLKEKLEQRDNIINKLIEIKYNFQNENSLFIFENDVLLKFMNDLQYIFNSKMRSDK